MVYEVDAPALRKARGAYFTPPEITQFIAGWAVRSATDIVLEPSCGEAGFLLEDCTRRNRRLLLPHLGQPFEEPLPRSQLIVDESLFRVADATKIAGFFECNPPVNH